MNMIPIIAPESDNLRGLVAFRDDAELSAALFDAAIGRGLPLEPAVALPLAVAYIRRLEARVRALEALQGLSAPPSATGGRP